MWDDVRTLTTGPVQDEVAPLWKVLPVAMRAGQNTDVFVRNKSKHWPLRARLHLCACVSERDGARPLILEKNTLEEQRSKALPNP